MLKQNQALMLIDIQVDFCQGGVLEVNNTPSLFEPLNQLIKTIEELNIPIIMTRDIHPLNHCSFHSNGGMWPIHCVEHTVGANFYSDLHIPNIFISISKGQNPHKDGYSAFEGTALSGILKKLGVQELLIAGIALEYCVSQTAQDAVLAGFQVTLLQDYIRPIDSSETAQDEVYKKLQKQGIKIIAKGNL